MERRHHDKQQSFGARRLDNAGTVALWIIHAHCCESWDHTPRLNIRAPEKGYGKTTLVDVISPLVPRSIKTENVSTAVVFRLMDVHKPTLLVDECDALLSGKNADPDLVSILNAGHGRSGRAYRCEGEDTAPEAAQDAAPAG